jgi:hypothetical protein
LREVDTEHLLDESTRPRPGGTGPQIPTLLDRLAALVPPPRVHHNRCFGVLEPNSLRAAVTALAAARDPGSPRLPDASRVSLDVAACTR